MSRVPVKFAQQPTPSWPYIPTRDDVMLDSQYLEAMEKYMAEWLTCYDCTGCEEDPSTGKLHLPRCPEPERSELTAKK